MTRLCLLGILLLNAQAEQRAIMRYDRSCLVLTEHSWAEAPMKNGEPDFQQVKLHGLVVTKNCGTIQITRAK